ALKFYSSLRLEVRRIETIEKGDEEAVGNKVRVKVVKNKVAPPFRRAELEIMFGKGISASGSLIDAAVRCGIIDKKGAWYTYGEEKLGQGRDNVKELLEKNQDLFNEIDNKVRTILFPGKTQLAQTTTLNEKAAQEARKIVKETKPQTKTNSEEERGALF
ncbi:MAG TPA: hypothetical protein PLV76_01520, partial [Spirochaetales bacterium]|nr:hypothetical protein [Spirochaetales bacterium]